MSRFTKLLFNKRRSIKKTFLPFLLSLLLGSNLFAQNANIVVTPATSNVTIGQTFNVKVRIVMVTADIDAASIFLDFDNTQINVSSISPVAGNPLPTETLPLDPVGTINTNGRIRYSSGTASAFPTTSFDYLDINFTVLPGATVGATTLTFNTAPPFITEVIRSGLSVTNTITNGTVNIAPACTPPTATIASNGSTTCNAQPFNLLLNAATGTGPWDLTINGTTYNNIPVGGTITTFTPPNQNIFGAADPNPTGLGNDDSYELGTKFQSSVAGYIKGVRFFSHPTAAADPAGTYTGHLWTAGGTLLASVTFTGVTSDAWQEALFSTPVEITANTTYVISYHTTSNQYVLTGAGLATAITNGTLTALDDATAGGNGVYFQSPTPGFPNLTFNSSNYWVDPVFSPKEYTFELTSVVDDAGCTATGAPLQTLTVTSVNCNTLPVTLLNLSATPQDKKITVRWATDGESNNKGFDLLRSTDGINWQTIAFINGAGNSSSIKNYSYVDLNLSPKRYYYRLKQIDFDGKYKISATVSAVIDGKASFSLAQNFPNPTVGGETTIQFTLAAATKVSLSLYDMHGRLVRVLATGAKDAGTHAIPVNTGSLTSGVYYYKLQAGDFSDVKKMTIQ